MKKYVVDTNVWLNSFQVVEELDGKIYIPLTVIRELDHQKHQVEKQNRQYMARQAINKMESFRNNETMKDRVELYDNTHIKLPENVYSSPYSINDDLIIETTRYLQKTNKDDDWTLVTNDLGMRLVAESYGIKTLAFNQDVCVSNEYTGYIEVAVSQEILDELYKLPSFNPYRYEEIISKLDNRKMINNAFYEIYCPDNIKVKLLVYYDAAQQMCVKLFKDKEYNVYGLTPLNKEQRYFIHLLKHTNLPCIQVKGSAGSGKAQPKTSMIMTANGWKLLGSIKIGDDIFGEDGKLHKVTGVYERGYRDNYKVIFSDGRMVECCNEHLWSYYDENDELQTVELQDIIESDNYDKYKIPVCKPIEFAANKHMQIDPYILGVIYANDEYCHYFSDNSLDIYRIDDKYIFNEDIINTLTSNNGYYTISKDNIQQIEILEKQVGNLNLSLEYLKCIQSNVEARERLFAGFTSNMINNTMTFLEMETADTFIYLARSLGKVCIKNTENIDNELVFKVILVEDNYITINSIEYSGKEDMRCIMIDSKNHLYITDDWVVTHNTLLSVAYARECLEKEIFDKFIYIKTLDPVSGKDIGYLPGEKDDKMQPHLAPLYDAMEVLTGYGREEVKAEIQNLIFQGKFEIEAISHMRGRSFQKTLLIIDEAENLDIPSLKTILTRAGKDSMIIILSDDEQIDNPKISSVSNGTALLKEKLVGEKLYGFIELKTSVRSPFTDLVTKLMI